MTRRRIAIVTPWYGPEATGGAETLARELASHLSVTEDVTILTTTARSFHADWSENFFKTGRTKENAYDVLRFPLAERNHGDFDRLNSELMQTPRAQWSGLTWQRARMGPFIEESINAPLLEEHLRGREATKYQAVVFLPYLYGVVVRGIEAFPGHAHLLPCLHDEAYARLPRIEDAVHRAETLLFNSDGEAELALRIYGPGVLHKSHVIGSGIAPSGNGKTSPVVAGQYFLFVGRRDATKGVDFLIEAFSRYRRERESEFSLVLAGPGDASFHDPGGGIIDLGFVDDATKHTLIREARALAQPSVNESYSRVIMEAWREETVVVARAGCLATATAVQRSGGGIIADGLTGWADAFAQLEGASIEELRELGRRGSAYAAVHSDWSHVVERFRDATGLIPPARRPRHGKRVDQVMQTLTYGDAISDYARSLRTYLQTKGFRSSIYARYIHPRVAADVELLTEKALAGSDVLVYHHSIAFNDLEAIGAAPGTKALIYHNITPASFFRNYDPAFAEHLERGRSQLDELADTFASCAADSEFNAAELRRLGFHNVKVVPVPVNFQRFDITPAPVPRSGAQWLFVGRISPNKCIRQLIEAFEIYASADPGARLILAGAYNPGDAYYQELTRLLSVRSLEAHVVLTGVVDEATLTAYYRNSTLFVCLSEHEGFCVPLVEAMFFDIPIVAKATTAVVETLGQAGVLIDADSDPVSIAALAREIHSNDALRERIIESQRVRRSAFLPEHVLPLVDDFLADIV